MSHLDGSVFGDIANVVDDISQRVIAREESQRVAAREAALFGLQERGVEAEEGRLAESRRASLAAEDLRQQQIAAQADQDRLKRAAQLAQQEQEARDADEVERMTVVVQDDSLPMDTRREALASLNRLERSSGFTNFERTEEQDQREVNQGIVRAAASDRARQLLDMVGPQGEGGLIDSDIAVNAEAEVLINELITNPKILEMGLTEVEIREIVAEAMRETVQERRDFLESQLEDEAPSTGIDAALSGLGGGRTPTNTTGSPTGGQPLPSALAPLGTDGQSPPPANTPGAATAGTPAETRQIDAVMDRYNERLFPSKF